MSQKYIRRIALLLAALVCLSVLCGCGPGEDEQTQPSTEASKPAVDKGYYTAEDYLADPGLFVPSWADTWQPPAEMLDFEEKYQQYFTPNGRVMSEAHRGDRNVLYPENSIEGVLSVVMAGVDIVEIDVHKTKDGVLVAFHDDDLLRTTNLALMRLNGQAKDLPESNNLADWTLEELRCLRLTMESGDGTNYVIPTLEEVIMVCKDRCFVNLDKFWRFDWNLDVVPLIEKHEAYRTVIVPYRYTVDMGFATVSYLLKRLKNASGYQPPHTFWAKPETISQVAADILKYDFPKAMNVGEYLVGDDDFYDMIAPYAGSYRLSCCTLVRDSDFPEVWAEAADKGVNIIMSNVNPYELCKFVAQRHFS